MKKTRITMTRRQILKTGLCAGAGMMLPWTFNRKAYAEALSYGLAELENLYFRRDGDRIPEPRDLPPLGAPEIPDPDALDPFEELFVAP